MINAGEFNKLKVTRKTDLGFMLTDGESEVLLHYSQSKKEHEPNDMVEVFIFFDKKKRPTATEIKPIAKVNEIGLFEVKEIQKELGAFVSNNTPKDVLYSKDILPKSYKAWPIVGDKLLGKLTLKGESFLVKRASKNDITSLNKNIKYELQENVSGYIADIAEKGILVVSKDLMAIYVPLFETRGDHRLGEEVTVSITKDMNTWYYGSLIKQKEFMIDEDKELILHYLQNYKVMKLTAKSSSEDIMKVFKISRKAFKRAYGGLYKDGLIDFDETKTWIVNK